MNTLTSDYPVTIGVRNLAEGRPFNGTIDEVRISNTARSIAWIATEYNNQNSTDTFYKVGSEETMINPAEQGWQYRKAIIINSSQVSGDLTNFPVLVNITDSDLKYKAQTDGDDDRGDPGATRHRPHPGLALPPRGQGRARSPRSGRPRAERHAGRRHGSLRI